MFGLGGQEILLLLIIGGLPALAFVMIWLTRSRRERALEDENRELRRRLDDREQTW